tara:strand:+ start:726 stop:1031 length:306 start_codon:yes stop_codon:yes gene_type:complete
MVFSKFRALFPTIIFILVCVVLSIIVLNYFQVDMNDNNGFRVLNRMLTIEGMCPNKKKEGMKNNEDEEEDEDEDEDEDENEVKIVDAVDSEDALKKIRAKI